MTSPSLTTGAASHRTAAASAIGRPASPSRSSASQVTWGFFRRHLWGVFIRRLQEQAERLAMCKLSFHVRAGSASGMLQQTIVDNAFFVDTDEDGDPAQGSLFAEKARLSEGFFQQLQKHPVPLEEAAIRALQNNSMALDLYAWAAYRLHSLKAPTPVSWRALKPQFGVAFGRMDNFRARVLDNLRLALAVYPEARVDVTDTGLLLHPSRPPVPPRIK
jgi:hypothetical protein